jgi:hypothetical protein
MMAGSAVQAQIKVKDGAGSALPNASAILDLESTNKGLLLPRVSLTTTTAWGLTGTSGASGMIVYNTNTSVPGTVTYPSVGAGLYYFDGTGWTAVHLSKAGAWGQNGNASVNPALDFVGTTDNQPLNLKVNNLNAGFISRPTDENTALGVEAGSGFMVTDGNPSSAAANTAIGYRALRDNTSGTENVAVGRGSLTVNLHNWNTAVGTWSLNTNKNGDGNTAVGANALTYLEDDFAGPTLGGNYNTAIGYNSLQNITAGSNNTALGAYADAADNVSNTTAIGANAYVSIDDAVVLGAAGVKVGIGTSAPRAELDVPGTGAIIVPVGDDSGRPATPVQGMIRFNTSTGHFEGYTGTAWVNLHP